MAKKSPSFWTEFVTEINKTEAIFKRAYTDIVMLKEAKWITDHLGRPVKVEAHQLAAAYKNTPKSTKDLITFLTATGSHDPRDVFRLNREKTDFKGYPSVVRFIITPGKNGQQEIRPIALSGKFGNYKLISDHFQKYPSTSFFNAFKVSRKELAMNWAKSVLANPNVDISVASEATRPLVISNNLAHLQQILDKLNMEIQDRDHIIYRPKAEELQGMQVLDMDKVIVLLKQLSKYSQMAEGEVGNSAYGSIQRYFAKQNEDAIDLITEIENTLFSHSSSEAYYENLFHESEAETFLDSVYQTIQKWTSENTEISRMMSESWQAGIEQATLTAKKRKEQIERVHQYIDAGLINIKNKNLSYKDEDYE